MLSTLWVLHELLRFLALKLTLSAWSDFKPFFLTFTFSTQMHPAKLQKYSQNNYSNNTYCVLWWHCECWLCSTQGKTNLDIFSILFICASPPRVSVLTLADHFLWKRNCVFIWRDTNKQWIQIFFVQYCNWYCRVLVGVRENTCRLGRWDTEREGEKEWPGKLNNRISHVGNLLRFTLIKMWSLEFEVSKIILKERIWK